MVGEDSKPVVEAAVGVGEGENTAVAGSESVETAPEVEEGNSVHRSCNNNLQTSLYDLLMNREMNFF